MSIKTFFLIFLWVFISILSLKSVAEKVIITNAEVISLRDQIRGHCGAYGQKAAEGFFEKEPFKMSYVHLSEKGGFSWFVESIRYSTTDIALYRCNFGISMLGEQKETQPEEIVHHQGVVYIWLTEDQELANNLQEESGEYQIVSIPFPGTTYYGVVKSLVWEMFSPYW